MKPTPKKITRRKSSRAKHLLYLGRGEFIQIGAATSADFLKHVAMILREVPGTERVRYFEKSLSRWVVAMVARAKTMEVVQSQFKTAEFRAGWVEQYWPPADFVKSVSRTTARPLSKPTPEI